jgi:hypothetical protein
MITPALTFAQAVLRIARVEISGQQRAQEQLGANFSVPPGEETPRMREHGAQSEGEDQQQRQSDQRFNEREAALRLAAVSPL